MKYQSQVVPIILLFVGFLVEAHASSGFKLNCLQNQHPFGVIATSPSLEQFEQDANDEPPRSKTGKSLVTYNRLGFDVVDDAGAQNSWLVQEIIQYSENSTQPILDIGGGYGYLSKLMLENGATVIYNDLDRRHLMYGRSKIDNENRKHLYLNTHTFPRGMILPKNSLSGVILHRVLHFMTSDEIEEGLAKINGWLVPNGKIFIAVLPPQHGEYREKVLEIFDERWDSGDSWPGMGFRSKDILPLQAYALPAMLHVMDERPLKRALEKYGFVVERLGYIDMKKYGQTDKRQGQELFGIVARKDASQLKRNFKITKQAN